MATRVPVAPRRTTGMDVVRRRRFNDLRPGQGAFPYRGGKQVELHPGCPSPLVGQPAAPLDRPGFNGPDYGTRDAYVKVAAGSAGVVPPALSPTRGRCHRTGGQASPGFGRKARCRRTSEIYGGCSDEILTSDHPLWAEAVLTSPKTSAHQRYQRPRPAPSPRTRAKPAIHARNTTAATIHNK